MDLDRGVRLTKEEFIKYVCIYEKMEADFAALENVIGSTLCESKLVMPIMQFANLLKDLMNDKYDYISEFAYTLNFGKSYKPGWCSDAKTGKEISFATAADLYDRLVEVQE